MNGNNNLQPGEIIGIVNEYYKKDILEVLDRSRYSDKIKVLHISMFFCKQFTKLSLSRIGMSFNRDHATVLHAVKSVNNQMDVYRDYKSEIDEIRERIKNKLIDGFAKYEIYDTDRV